jgi:pseudaminic acid cytidylyltransferase
MSDCVAIIPARGGSKRLPRKNIALVHGFPVIAYTISAALESKAVSRIIVSTEDPEIAEIAENAGAEVHHRHPDLAQDDVGVVDVCIDVLMRLHADGVCPETFCCLYATAALRTAEDIVCAKRILDPASCEFVMGVTEYQATPFHALVTDKNGYLKLMWSDFAEASRQRRPVVVVDNGSVYWCETASFLKHKTFYGPTLRGYMMPRSRSVDLDTAEDLELMEFYAAKASPPAMADKNGSAKKL